MKNVLLLLLIAGALTAGWMHRDKWMPKQAAEEAAPEEMPVIETPAGVPTPHPARESQATATRVYPALGMPNSAFNKKFVALYAEAQKNDPAMLAQPNWPLKLAERTAVALGGAPLAVPIATPPPGPSQMQGSALDARPAK